MHSSSSSTTRRAPIPAAAPAAAVGLITAAPPERPVALPLPRVNVVPHCHLELRELQIERLNSHVRPFVAVKAQLEEMAAARVLSTSRILQGLIEASPGGGVLTQVRGELADILKVVDAVQSLGDLEKAMDLAKKPVDEGRCPICNFAYVVEMRQPRVLRCGQHACTQCCEGVEACPFCRGDCVR